MTQEEITLANKRHDAIHGRVGQKPAIRSTWNSGNLTRGKYLTDRKIETYQAEGHYSPELREARKALREKKAKRTGNFIEVEGRLIYSL